jgi:predicted double-glycine peptidase
MRFIKQKDTYSCAPVAIANILKLLGIKTYKNHKVNQGLIKILKEECKTNEHGSLPYIALDVLRSIKELKIKGTCFPTYELIKEEIDSGHIVLIDCSCRSTKYEWNDHFTVLFRNADGKYELVNSGEDLGSSLVISHMHIINKLRFDKINDCWFIKKE